MVYLCRGCTEMPLLHWPNAAFIEEAHNVDVFVLVGHLNERRVVDALSEGKIVLHIVKEPDAGVVILDQSQYLLYIPGYMPVLLAHDYVDVCPVLRIEPVVQQFHIAVELFQPRPHFVAIPVL